MQQVTAIANVKGGKLELVNQKDFRNQMAITFPNDCIVNVIVERHARKRSNQQNSYLWGVPYKLLSGYTGYTSEEIHQICKLKFLGENCKIGDEEFEIGRTTKSLTTVEFEEYAENIRRWGATLGVNIPLPNENIEPNGAFDILNQGLELTEE